MSVRPAAKPGLSNLIRITREGNATKIVAAKPPVHDKKSLNDNKRKSNKPRGN